jgi:GNAT superfamily N-acetyltransferase
MYESFGPVKLKSGETVELCVVKAPDPEWAPRVIDLLGHKGDIWNKQNRQTLTMDLGVNIHYYLLQRDNVPFSNILVSDYQGMGMLGHVWTVPDDRRKGAASILMEKVISHFAQRGGKAMILATAYDSAPYHIYAKYGFEGIENDSGIMDWYAQSRRRFERDYFEECQPQLQPVSWKHWPTSAPILVGDYPGAVRCAPLGIIGRLLPEEALLPLILDNAERAENKQPPRGHALVNPDNGAVLGLSAWAADPLWPDTHLVDVYCHPSFWDRGRDLLGALEIPDTSRQMAYAESNCPGKLDLLESAGFKHTVTLPIRVAADRARTAWTDVLVYEKY